MHVNILVHNNKTVRLPPESLLCLSDIYGAEMLIRNSTILIKNIWAEVLPPANEVCEGYVFTRVCLSTGRGGGIPACLAGFQPTPTGEVEGSGQVGGGGSPGSHPRDKLRGLAWGGSPGPHPGGSPGPHPGGCIPACTEADPPTDSYCCGQYASYWNAFLSSFFLFIFTAQLWDKIVLDGGCHYCVGSLTRAQISFTKMVFISADDFSLVATK